MSMHSSWNLIGAAIIMATMLFACKGQDYMRLVYIGSRVVHHRMSSYLGELDAIRWACARTKAFRGSVPLIIKTDNYGVVSKGAVRELSMTMM